MKGKEKREKTGTVISSLLLSSTANIEGRRRKEAGRGGKRQGGKRGGKKGLGLNRRTSPTSLMILHVLGRRKKP